jgi:ketosteroid isomerase-like protein
MAIVSATINETDTTRLTRLYQRYSHGDITVIDDLFSEDIVAHLIGDTLLAADYIGKQALREFIARTIEMNNSPERYRLGVDDVLVGHGHVAFVGRVIAQARGNAPASVIRSHDLLRLDDRGRVAEMWSLVLPQRG